MQFIKLITFTLLGLLAGFIIGAPAMGEVLIKKNFAGGYDGNQVLTIPAKGKFDPAKGQIEVWLSPEFDPLKNNKNQGILYLQAGNSSLNIYFNANDKSIVFFHFNPENTALKAKRGYCFILSSGDIGWKKGEKHYIKITWDQKGERKVFIDDEAKAFAKTQPLFHNTGQVYLDKAFWKLGGGNFNIKKIIISNSPESPIASRRKKKATLKYSQLPEAPEKEKYLKQSVWGWRLGNNYIDCIIDKQNGMINAFFLKGKKINILDSPAGVSVNKKSIGIEDTPEITPLTGQNSPGIKVFYRVAKISIEYKINKDYLSWSITEAGKTEENSSVSFKFPFLNHSKKLYGFVPHYLGEFPINNTVRQSIYGEPGHLSFPMTTIFNRIDGYGLTFIAPLETDKKIFFNYNILSDNSFNVLCRVKKFNEKQKTTTLMIIPHGGDYRPGLGWAAKLYAKYFRDAEGLMGFSQCGGISTPETVKMLSGNGLKWRFLSTDSLCGGYGLWIPEKIENKTSAAITNIKEQIKILHANGIKALLYCQGYETSFQKTALEKYADSIMRDAQGKSIMTPFGFAMNPYPGSAWFNHILDQVKKMMDTFPEADGFFWDWGGVDRQYFLIEKASEVIHKRGKFLVGNNPYGRSWRFMDNALAECSTRNLCAMQYLGLKYPITYLPVYYGDLPHTGSNEIRAAGMPKNAEGDLKNCLITGCFLMFNYQFAYHGKSLDLLRKYSSLLDHLRFREWVYSVNPVEVPEYLKYNIFKKNDDNYVISLVSKTKSYFDSSLPYENIPLRINLNDAADITDIKLISVDYPGQQKLNFKRKGKVIDVIIPKHKSASILLLNKRK